MFWRQERAQNSVFSPFNPHKTLKTSILFSHFLIQCLSIHCSSHSLLPAPLCGPARGFQFAVGRHNGGIDTGDLMRSARRLHPCCSLFMPQSNIHRESGGISGEFLRRCWHEKKASRKRHSSLIQLPSPSTPSPPGQDKAWLLLVTDSFSSVL